MSYVLDYLINVFVSNGLVKQNPAEPKKKAVITLDSLY